MQRAREQRFVNGGHLQSLSFLVVPHNQHPLSGHALPQHLRLSVVRHVDPEQQAPLHTTKRGKFYNIISDPQTYLDVIENCDTCTLSSV